MIQPAVTALSGTLVSLTGDPFLGDPGVFVHEPDGLTVCRDGLIQAVGPMTALRQIGAQRRADQRA